MNETDSPSRILMVEDSDSDALLLQEACREMGGLSVEQETSAAAALRRLTGHGAERPRLILLDSKLPDVDGIVFARRLVTEHGWDRRRIVMLCGIPVVGGEPYWGLWLEKPGGWDGWQRVVRTIARHAADVNSSVHA